MRLVTVVFAVCVAAGCRDHAQAASAVTASSGNEKPASIVMPSTQPSDSAMWQDSSCEVETAYAHSSASQLIREFLARNDSLGFFAGGGDANDHWLFGAEECPGHSGGTDGAAVVRTYGIDSLPAGRDSARYVVRYELLGSTTPEVDHMRFVPRAEEVQDTLVLIKTPYGWRITGDPGDPFMSPAAVIRQAGLDSASIQRLDSAVRATGPASRPAPNER